jgi:hypothetical protein
MATTKISYATIRQALAGVAVNLNLKNGSVSYTGITGETILIAQPFNYIQIFNESAANEIFVCLHTGITVSATNMHGVIRIPPLAGYEERQMSIGWISLINSGASATASIILRTGGLV